MPATTKSSPVLDRHCQMKLFKITYHIMQVFIKKLKRFVFFNLGTFAANMMDLGTFTANMMDLGTTVNMMDLGTFSTIERTLLFFPT